MVEQLLKNQFKFICKRKIRERKILDNLNLEFFPSEIIAVVGGRGR
jgi:ABC-type transporter Mla maintaining outer membrane lipid asymmetry ATPase subunit MlaF